MLRRSILQLASHSSVRRVPLKTTTQLPSFLSSRRRFSVSHKNASYKPDLGSNVPESHNRVTKILVGGLALGSVVLAAYYNGILDEYIGKDEKKSSKENSKAQIDDTNIHEVRKETAHPLASEFSESVAESNLQDSNISSSFTVHTKEDAEAHPEIKQSEDAIRSEVDNNINVKDTGIPLQGNIVIDRDTDLSNDLRGILSSYDASGKPAEESINLETEEVKPDKDQSEAIDISRTFTSSEENPTEIEIKSIPSEQISDLHMQEVFLVDETKNSTSLLDDYSLGDDVSVTTNSSKLQKDIASTTEDAYEGYILKDGKLVIDFLQAIHAAEKRQAELDAYSFNLERRAMKENYEKELKDARARELMYAERESILDKELNKERAKVAATVKSLQERFEEKLKTELEEKDTEVELKLKKVHDIAKAELAAAIATEKASQIEKMAEANLHINALCMAFYARSEETRQSHSVQKLALGVLALEDALSSGLPIQNELKTLHSLEGVNKDSLVSLVLSSLPEETQKHGTDTLLQLNQKFDSMKETLRHFSLIPPSGGGFLSHSLASIASWLKVKEVDHSGDGIESLINKVDNLLAHGRLCEAADTLESGLKDTQAAGIVTDWVRQARNRAITEQALTVLQSYATSICVA